MSDPAWEEYLAAARRLDALRRGAATAEDEPGRAATATLAELTRVRAQLATQHTELRALGVPEDELLPSPAELAAAARDDRAGLDGGDGGDRGGTAGADQRPGADGPGADGFGTDGRDGLAGTDGRLGGLAGVDGLGAVWTALRRSRALAERADAILAAPRGWTARFRGTALARGIRGLFTRTPR